jgi:hypothetical protein
VKFLNLVAVYGEELFPVDVGRFEGEVFHPPSYNPFPFPSCDLGCFSGTSLLLPYCFTGKARRFLGFAIDSFVFTEVCDFAV